MTLLGSDSRSSPTEAVHVLCQRLESLKQNFLILIEEFVFIGLGPTAAVAIMGTPQNDGGPRLRNFKAHDKCVLRSLKCAFLRHLEHYDRFERSARMSGYASRTRLDYDLGDLGHSTILRVAPYSRQR